MNTSWKQSQRGEATLNYLEVWKTKMPSQKYMYILCNEGQEFWKINYPEFSPCFKKMRADGPAKQQYR
jgi:hypothetical protein